MPIFTRRRLQAMLNDLAPRLDEAKGKDLLRRLENKRVEQALPAEMELALLWGLLQLGDVEVEPDWFALGRLPDAYSELLFAPQPAAIEIAAISDASLAQEDEMRRTASLLCEAANRIRRGEGHHLYFHFGEESGYTPEGYMRRRKVDPGFTVTDDIAVELRAWITSAGSAAQRAPLRVTAGRTDLVVTWHDHKQSRHSNFFSTMPAEAYSLTDNPVHSTLKAKADQLRSADFQGVRCLLLADAGSRLLRHLDESMRSPGAVTGRQIIDGFLSQPKCGLDVVCVFSPRRHMDFMSFPRKPLTWQVSAFVRPGVEVAMSGLERLASVLPRPRFEGYQARSLQQQPAYAPDSRGWYVGTNITSGRTKMTISISARALLDLLAGRLTQEHFQHAIGMDASRGRTNLFKLCLDRGEVISIVLPVANEYGVRQGLQSALPPLMIHASTGNNWNVTFGRHIPGRDDCFAERFAGVDKAPKPGCSGGQLPQSEPDAPDASLPFLSFWAGFVTAVDLVRLGMPGYPQVPNHGLYSFRKGTFLPQLFAKTAKPSCDCNRQGVVFAKLRASTRFRALSPAGW